MIHKFFPVGPVQCNCSVIGDEATHEAMVIDPGGDVERILDVVAQHGLTVKQIVLTHAHIDHVGGVMQLKKLTGAPLAMHPGDQPLLDMMPSQAAWLGMQPPEPVVVDRWLNDGDMVTVGGLTARVIHTPGHTEGGICLYFEAEGKLIAGDTLFAGSVGRTDLPGGNYEKLMASLHTRVMALPDVVEVTCGHGPMTYIGVERESNPFLQ
jgi:glyoxylase-like metal-dependent hydrolase (beta-lactamase superfamily II)